MTEPTESPRPRIVLVFPSQSYRVEAFLRAAARMGVELALGTDLPAAFAQLGAEVIALDLRSPEEAAARLVAEGRSTPFAAILGTNEQSALVAALASRALGLPCSSPEGALAARDKRRMRALFAEHGVPSPRFRVLPRDADPRALVEEQRFPCVVKPPMLTGSQGVIRADTPDELFRAVARVRAILDHHTSPAARDPSFHDVIVEDYLPGREVAVEALMTDGVLSPLAIFDKPDDLTGPFFEETLYVTPSRLGAAEQRDLLDVTARAARAMGLGHGPIHAELRTHQGRAAMVELAARSIGGLCSRVFQLAAGPLEDLLIAHALGRPIAPRVASGAAGVMMMPIPRSAVLREVSGLDEARAVPGVDEVTIAARPGEALRALPEGASYLGFLFAHGDSPEAVELSLRTAFAALRFTWSPLLEPLR
jgi:biotin carboxylase